MPPRLKLVIGLLATAVAVGVPMAIYDYTGAERMAFDGTIRSIEWKSENHALPLISLNTNNGVKWVQHYRLLVDPKLKVGDHFTKIAGSRNCTINGVIQRCVP